MSRVRKINPNPPSTNYYLVDACFLANRYISPDKLPLKEREQVERCKKWWTEIENQLEKRKAIVYVPDVCIAEAFQVLAKKYYRDHAFASAAAYGQARKRLSRDITTSTRVLKRAARQIKFHDISTSRDVIIAVDRFLEVFQKNKLKVSTPDLIVLATAKYLIDFYRIPSSMLYVITCDGPLHRGSRKFRDIPSTFNPISGFETADRVFLVTK
jgi:predicted nucleic acid-binding protein